MAQITINTRISPENHAWLLETSKKTGISQASLVNQALDLLREEMQLRAATKKK